MNETTMQISRRMRGFSLVELMVAMTMSLVLLAGALSILYSTRLTYTQNDRLARIQEAGRTSMELIQRDVRSAGFNGCSRLDPTKYNNGLNGAATLLWNFSVPVFGFEATGGAWVPAMDAVVTAPAPTVGSDVLVVRGARQGQSSFRTNATTVDPTADITVDTDAGATIPVGSTLIIGDCEYASVFQVTSFASGGATATIGHAAGGANGTNVDNSIRSEFSIESLVMPVDTVVYYVAPAAAGGGPGLWQIVGGNAPQLLIPGVENIQLRYGVDTNNDLQADVYQTADLVLPVTRWRNVVSVSIAMLIRTENESGPDLDTGTYTLLGTVIDPPDDRRLRSVFTTTIALRNNAT
jgi:type IV pilus assembly protein PilW